MNNETSQFNNIGQQVTYPVDYNSQQIIGNAMSSIYPIGSIYINASVSTNPNILFGFGIWQAWGSGKVIVGVDTTDADFEDLEQTGGEKTHVLTLAEAPDHTHGVVVGTTGSGTYSGLTVAGPTNNPASLVQTLTSGSNAPHNNVQPYITAYIWKRTA